MRHGTKFFVCFFLGRGGTYAFGLTTQRPAGQRQPSWSSVPFGLTTQSQAGQRQSSWSSSSSSLLSSNGDGSSSSNIRQPWDVLRFLRQSSRFVSLLPQRPKSSSGPVSPGKILWKAGSPDNDFTFGPLDDVVMGGASDSTFNAATGKWKGTVTDANNGGFVGIRSTPTIEYDLTPCRGIEWVIRATNKMRLKVVVRDSTEFNGIGWRSSQETISTTGRMGVVRIPFDKQVPTRFAKIVPQPEAFNKAGIKSFQLVYSKFEYDGALNPNFQVGDFEIQLLELRTY